MKNEKVKGKNEKLRVKKGRYKIFSSLFSLISFPSSFFFFLFFLFTFLLPISAFAQDRVIDNAGLLSTQEKANLNQLMAAIAADTNFNLVIVTENSIGAMDINSYVDGLFARNSYGLGQNRDGCVLVQVIGSRDYELRAWGRGIRILNAAAFNKLEADTVKYLSADNPYQAYQAFILDWQQFLDLEAKGRSYNFFHQWNVVLIVIAWVIALATGFIVVQVWKGGMNTAHTQTQAAAYVIPGSLNYKEKKDTFLYSNVSKTRRQTSSSTSVSTASKGTRSGKY